MATPVRSDLDFASTARLINVPIAVAPGQPIVFEQFNSAVEGLSWKDNARVRAATNVNLAAPGATIDGIAMSLNDRFVAAAQTTTPEVGIYVYNGAATPATRSLDANTADELESAVISIDEGTSAGSTFRQTTVNFVLGTGTPVFVAFGTAAPAASETVSGVAELATQAEVNAGTDDLRIVTPLKLAASTFFAKGFTSAPIGDGTATSFTITHNLNSQNVDAVVRRNAAPFEQILCDIENSTVNTCTVRIIPAASAAQFIVHVTRVS